MKNWSDLESLRKKKALLDEMLDGCWNEDEQAYIIPEFLQKEIKALSNEDGFLATINQNEHTITTK